MGVTIDGRTWTLGESIGSGGFGRVYVARSNDQEAVLKLVPKDPGAQRELLLAGDLSGVTNVVPVLGLADAGDSWAILMPRAEQSLRDLLVAAAAPIEQATALPILLDVARALVSLETKGVVHRDVKPENILLLDGHWCLTDFGISRYAEATTAADTRKYSMTRPYAAPEQWRAQRATSATDVYAFGVLAFELLAGHWPFPGPDFRDQHLHHQPASLSTDGDNPVHSIIDECLTKAPGARPTPARLLARLQAQVNAEAPTGGVAALIEAHRREVDRISAAARQQSQAQSEDERRADLFQAAASSYERLRSRLDTVIRSAAPSVSDRLPLRLGHATLTLTAPARSKPGNRVTFDVIAHAEIRVDQADAPGGWYVGRSHSLWYCDAQVAGQYAWFETAFMVNPLMGSQGGFDGRRLAEPFAASPEDNVAQQAVGIGIGTHQAAWPFTPLIDEGVDDFIDRWTTWFAAASTGRLQHPHTMPERPIDGSWRRH